MDIRIVFDFPAFSNVIQFHVFIISAASKQVSIFLPINPVGIFSIEDERISVNYRLLLGIHEAHSIIRMFDCDNWFVRERVPSAAVVPTFKNEVKRLGHIFLSYRTLVIEVIV